MTELGTTATCLQPRVLEGIMHTASPTEASRFDVNAGALEKGRLAGKVNRCSGAHPTKLLTFANTVTTLPFGTFPAG